MSIYDETHELASDRFARRVDELLVDTLGLQHQARYWLSDAHHGLDHNDPAYEQSLEAAETLDATVHTLRGASEEFHLFGDPSWTAGDRYQSRDLVGESADGVRVPSRVLSAGLSDYYHASTLADGADAFAENLVQLGGNVVDLDDEASEWLYFQARHDSDGDPTRVDHALDAVKFTATAAKAAEVTTSQLEEVGYRLPAPDATPHLAIVPEDAAAADTTALLADATQVRDGARMWLADAHRTFDHDDVLYTQALDAASAVDDAVDAMRNATHADHAHEATASTGAASTGADEERPRLIATDENGAHEPVQQHPNDDQPIEDRDLRRDGLCEESAAIATHLSAIARDATDADTASTSDDRAADAEQPASALGQAADALRNASDRFGGIYTTTRTTGQPPDRNGAEVERPITRAADPFVELEPAQHPAYGYEPPTPRDAEAVLGDLVYQLGHDHEADYGSHLETSPQSEPELRYRSAVVAEAVVPGLVGTDKLRDLANQYREHEDAHREGHETLTGRRDDPMAFERGMAVSDTTAFVYGDDYYTLPPTMVGDLISDDARETAYHQALASGGMSRDEADRLHEVYGHADPDAYENAQFRDDPTGPDPFDPASASATSADCQQAIARAEDGLQQVQDHVDEVEDARWHTADRAGEVDRAHDQGPVIETEPREPY